jgi:hypothetical protein
VIHSQEAFQRHGLNNFHDVGMVMYDNLHPPIRKCATANRVKVSPSRMEISESAKAALPSQGSSCFLLGALPGVMSIEPFILLLYSVSRALLETRAM